MWEAIINAIASLRPLAIVAQYQRGVLLRCGRFRRELSPGWHLIWPVVDHAIVKTVVTRTDDLLNISRETLANRSIGASGYVRWHIFDIKRACLNVEHVEQDVPRLALSELSDAIRENDRTDAEPTDVALDAIGRKAERWGVAIEDVSLSDYLPVIGIRQIQS